MSQKTITVRAMQAVLVCFVLGGVYVTFPSQTQAEADAMGGPGAEAFQEQSDTVLRMRRKQAVLSRREDILRSQLKVLERAMLMSGETYSDELRRSRNDLVLLLRDQRSTEDQIVEFLRQLTDAEGLGQAASFGKDVPGIIRLIWPVEPKLGISAHFHDQEYEKRFGLRHEAIDIPIAPGTNILASADGVVEAVADNGMGYNFLIIRHDGFATLYGHIRTFLVEEGQEVKQGDAIAQSGGVPGTPGAGPISTGGHVHFEMIVQGQRIDPLGYLPYGTEIVRKQVLW